MMSTTRTGLGDDTPVLGGGAMPDFLRNDRLPDLPPDSDSLTADLMVVMSTNPGKVAFRAIDVAELDTGTKRTLLLDLYRSLGITPLRKVVP